MKKFRTILVGFMIVTTGCNSNLFADPTNTPTFTPTIDTTATAGVIAAQETQSALETQEVESLHVTETVRALHVTETVRALFKEVAAPGATNTAKALTERAKATDTPTSTPSSASSGGSVGFTNCQDSTGGRTKVRVENNTGGIAYLTLVGPETRYCAIAGGVVQIFLKGGVYTVTANMCGIFFNFGSFVINSTWKLILKC